MFYIISSREQAFKTIEDKDQGWGMRTSQYSSTFPWTDKMMRSVSWPSCSTGKRHNSSASTVYWISRTPAKICTTDPTSSDRSQTGGGIFPLANHGFEHLGFHDQPMILYADCEYTVPLNPTHEPDATLDLLLKHVRHALTELLMFNNQTDKQVKINVETCHRPGVKVSFHLKISRILIFPFHKLFCKVVFGNSSKE